MFKPVLDFFGQWYEFSAKEHLAAGFGICIVCFIVTFIGSMFFMLLNG